MLNAVVRFMPNSLKRALACAFQSASMRMLMFVVFPAILYNSLPLVFNLYANYTNKSIHCTNSIENLARNFISRGSMVKPMWNTGASEAREDMPRKGLNKAEERRIVFPPVPGRVWGAWRRAAGVFRVAAWHVLAKGRRGPIAR